MKGYQELIDVVSADGLGALETEWSDWVSGLWWATRLLLRASAEQPYDILFQRKGGDGTLGEELTASSAASATVPGTRAEADYDMIAGTAFRVGVRNTGETAGDFRLSVVLV